MVKKKVQSRTAISSTPREETPEEIPEGLSQINAQGLELLALIRAKRKKNGESVSLLFEELIGEDELPDYYERVKKPISIAEIEPKLRANEYQSIKEMQDDFALMVSNAKNYNKKKAEAWLDADKIDYIIKTFFKRIKDAERRANKKAMDASQTPDVHDPAAAPRINLKIREKPQQKIRLKLSKDQMSTAGSPAADVNEDDEDEEMEDAEDEGRETSDSPALDTRRRTRRSLDGDTKSTEPSRLRSTRSAQILNADRLSSQTPDIKQSATPAPQTAFMEQPNAIATSQVVDQSLGQTSMHGYKDIETRDRDLASRALENPKNREYQPPETDRWYTRYWNTKMWGERPPEEASTLEWGNHLVHKIDIVSFDKAGKACTLEKLYQNENGEVGYNLGDLPHQVAYIKIAPSPIPKNFEHRAVDMRVYPNVKEHELNRPGQGVSAQQGDFRKWCVQVPVDRNQMFCWVIFTGRPTEHRGSTAERPAEYKELPLQQERFYFIFNRLPAE